jgi:hypothetical protein
MVGWESGLMSTGRSTGLLSAAPRAVLNGWVRIGECVAVWKGRTGDRSEEPRWAQVACR